MNRNALLFAVMCLVWGLTFLPVKIATGHVPPVFLASLRFALAGVVLVAWAGRDILKVPAQAWPRLVVTALLVNAGNYSFMFWGAAHAPSGLAAIVNMVTIPIYSLLASRVIEGGRIGYSQIPRSRWEQPGWVSCSRRGRPVGWRPRRAIRWSSGGWPRSRSARCSIASAPYWPVRSRR